MRLWYGFYTVIEYNFEFDLRKSVSNKVKHGIDFDQAKRLWDDLNFVEVPAVSTDEPRFLIIGKIDNRHWSAITTVRVGRIRIISVRRSRASEVELYEGT